MASNQMASVELGRNLHGEFYFTNTVRRFFCVWCCENKITAHAEKEIPFLAAFFDRFYDVYAVFSR